MSVIIALAVGMMASGCSPSSGKNTSDEDYDGLRELARNVKHLDLLD